ncbi:MAG: hypothetical protein AABX11_01770 [Nanoarchaeota archaeon]
MGFGSIFKNAWNEFFDNVGAISLFLLLFLVPILVLGIVCVVCVLALIYSSLILVKVLMVLLLCIVFVLFVGVGVFVNASFYGMKVSSKKYSWRMLVQVGKSAFWRFLGRGILLFLCIIGLFLLLIVPGIIFSVYWIFAIFIWFDEPKRSFSDSLRRSKELVKGKWWNVFGCVLLFCVIEWIIMFILDFVPVLNVVGYLFLGIFSVYFFRHMYIEYSKRRA